MGDKEGGQVGRRGEVLHLKNPSSMGLEERDVDAAITTPVRAVAHKGNIGITCWQRPYVIEPG